MYNLQSELFEFIYNMLTVNNQFFLITTYLLGW